jgi:hypothetical protein
MYTVLQFIAETCGTFKALAWNDSVDYLFAACLPFVGI